VQHPRAIRAVHAVAAGLPLLFALACQPGSPEERAAAARARYNASINGWVIDEGAPTRPPLEVADTALADDAEEPLATPAAEEAGAGPRDVILDIQLWHNSAEMLPGITLDVTHADEAEQVKGSYQVWVDTSRLARGQHIQVNHRLEGIEVAAGDRFAAEVRHPVPAAERHRYRELEVSGGATE
jgi:hypothetical protein